MRKIFLIFIAAMLIMTTVALAVDANDPSQIKILPDSNIYSAKLFFENIRVDNAFSYIGKAKLSVRYAQRRLMEAEIMSKNGNDYYTETLLAASVTQIQYANDFMKKQVLKKEDIKTEDMLTTIALAQVEISNRLQQLIDSRTDNAEYISLMSLLDDQIVETMVIKAFVLYKGDYFSDSNIYGVALQAYEQAKQNDVLGIEAISVATVALGIIESQNITPSDAVTMATALVEQGGQNPIDWIGGTDTTSGATPVLPPAPSVLGSGGVDTISTATTVIPQPTQPPSNPGVDGITSATVVLQNPPGTTTVYHDDDEDDDDEDNDD